MKYCCTVREKHGTCYQELKKGKYEGIHWSEDSLLLYDDYVDELQLYDLWIKVLPTYDRWGITEVDSEAWRKLWEAAKQIGGEIEIVMGEINAWAQENFKTERVFTILGV